MLVCLDRIVVRQFTRMLRVTEPRTDCKGGRWRGSSTAITDEPLFTYNEMQYVKRLLESFNPSSLSDQSQTSQCHINRKLCVQVVRTI